MAYWYCYYRVIWATQYRKPIITPYLEPLIYQWIKDKSEAIKSEVLAVNGVEDHIHVAVTIPPTLAATEWVRHVKGFSAHKVNGVFPDAADLFKWQLAPGICRVSLIMSVIRNAIMPKIRSSIRWSEWALMMDNYHHRRQEPPPAKARG